MPCFCINLEPKRHSVQRICVDHGPNTKKRAPLPGSVALRRTNTHPRLSRSQAAGSLLQAIGSILPLHVLYQTPCFPAVSPPPPFPRSKTLLHNQSGFSPSPLFVPAFRWSYLSPTVFFLLAKCFSLSPLCAYLFCAVSCSFACKKRRESPGAFQRIYHRANARYVIVCRMCRKGPSRCFRSSSACFRQ